MKFLVGLPSVDGKASIDVVKSILDQLDFITKYKHVMHAGIIKNTLIHNARNALASTAIELGYDYLFFVDSDCVLPVGALEQLTKYDKDIVSGMYFQKAFPYLPVLYNLNEKGTFDMITAYPEKKLIRVGGVGMGVCLIKVSALKKLGYTLKDCKTPDGGDVQHVDSKVFDPLPEFEGKPAINGEDTAFCRRCNDAGINIYADTGIQAVHLGERGITEAYYRESLTRFTPEQIKEMFSMGPTHEI